MKSHFESLEWSELLECDCGFRLPARSGPIDSSLHLYYVELARRFDPDRPYASLVRSPQGRVRVPRPSVNGPDPLRNPISLIDRRGIKRVYGVSNLEGPAREAARFNFCKLEAGRFGGFEREAQQEISRLLELARAEIR